MLTEILYVLWLKRNESYAGVGHDRNLYEHTLSVVKKSWVKGCDPLIPLAAAHDIGKLITFKKNNETGEGEKVGYHDEYGGRILVTLKSYEAPALRADEKIILKTVTGYSHKKHKIPIFEEPIARRISEIFKATSNSDRVQTKEEKQNILNEPGIEKTLTEAFKKTLIELPFQTENSHRGEASVCFRKDDLVYLLEPGFRDSFLRNLPEKVAAAFGDGFRRIGNMSPPTVALINHLKNIRWLVETGNGMTSECGLWSVEIGTKVFNGVIVVKLPISFPRKLTDETR